jgi:hypothetical protein
MTCICRSFSLYRADMWRRREARQYRPFLSRMASCSRPSIGIGGRLAAPPLPHHRAYGSVPRRFGGLSARQCIHGEQPKTFETSVGEGTMQRARRT